MHMKISSAKWRPFCPGEDELTRVKDEPSEYTVTLQRRYNYAETTLRRHFDGMTPR